MKISKSYKIITLIVALALALLGAVLSFDKTAVSADVDPNSYFTFSGGNDKIKFDEDKLVVTAKTGDELKFNNAVVIDEFELKQELSDDIEKIEITFESDSYYASGAVNAEGKIDKKIKNVLTIDKANGKFDLNGIEKTGVTDFSSLKIAVKNGSVGGVDVNNLLSATVGGETASNSDIYYQVGGNDKTHAEVSIKFTLKSGYESADYSIISVDQKTSDDTGAYKQTFEMEDGNFKTVAKPRVSVKSGFKSEEDNWVFAVSGVKYSLTFEKYSLLGTSFSCRITDTDAGTNGGVIWTPIGEENPTEIAFYKVDTVDLDNTMTFTVGSSTEDMETYSVEFMDTADDGETPRSFPVFTADDSVITYYKDAWENYYTALKNATKKEYSVTNEQGVVSTETHYVRLGDSVSIPSFDGLIYEDVTPYDKLSYTVYYRTPSSSSGTSSSMKIALTDPGDYMFYVLFKDENGNVFDHEDVEDKIKAGEFSDKFTAYAEGIRFIEVEPYSFVPVFTFHIEDDAPIYVYPTAVQQKGYIGTQYVASPFTIEESGSQTVYTLYYNANTEATAGDSGWVKIPTLSAIEEDYSENGFNYEDIKGINYDGKLTFTPVKGAYYIDCKVTSQKSDRSMSGKTDIIRVVDEIKEVKVDTHWLQNNLLSVIFLGIGTACLIGIVVLLFIKPKEEAVDSEEDK